MGRPKMLGEGPERVRGVTLAEGQVEAIRRLQAAELAAAGVEPPRAEVIRRALDAGLPALERGDAPGFAATTAPAPEGPTLADVLAEVRALRRGLHVWLDDIRGALERAGAALGVDDSVSATLALAQVLAGVDEALQAVRRPDVADPFGWNAGGLDDAIRVAGSAGWAGAGDASADGAFDIITRDGGQMWRVRRTTTGQAVALNVPDAHGAVYMISWVGPGTPTACYIGKSKNPQARIRAHIGDILRGWGAERVVEYVKTHRPPADHWFFSVLEWTADNLEAKAVESRYIESAFSSAPTSTTVLNSARTGDLGGTSRGCVWSDAAFRGGGVLIETDFLTDEMSSWLVDAFGLSWADR